MSTCDIRVSGPRSFRGEVRFQHDFLNDQMSSYSFDDSRGPYITAKYPPVRLSTVIALLFGEVRMEGHVKSHSSKEVTANSSCA
jgi:hypothetical protein